jgi:hypothetical protein
MTPPPEALATFYLPDGRVAYAIPSLFGAYITVATPDSDEMGFYDEMFTYKTTDDAFRALKAWDGTPGSEPEGWIRHQPSNRRRKDGDPARETVRP